MIFEQVTLMLSRDVDEGSQSSRSLHLGSLSLSNPHEDQLGQWPTSGPDNSETQTLMTL